VYLHGIFDPRAASDEMGRQSRVTTRALRRGFAVLAVHGRVGECSAHEYASQVCWPSNERDADDGPGFVAEWKEAIATAEQRGATGNRYVLGFSNGGYFAGLLAEREWFPAAAYVIARGGPVMPVTAAGKKSPILLILSEDDPSYEEMVRLDEELSRAGWYHELYRSSGDHALADTDIEAAMQFFERQEGQKL
jgi:predicted esterase